MKRAWSRVWPWRDDFYSVTCHCGSSLEATTNAPARIVMKVLDGWLEDHTARCHPDELKKAVDHIVREVAR